MGPAFLWLALGYASCVWDCASSPLGPRWPSATGIFILLLVIQMPRVGLWGAALCGLILDAAHGGPLGPRMIAGVIATALASHLQLGRAETGWVRAILVSATANALWLGAPLIPRFLAGGISSSSWALTQSLATTTVSTTLIVLAIRSVIRSKDHGESL